MSRRALQLLQLRLQSARPVQLGLLLRRRRSAAAGRQLLLELCDLPQLFLQRTHTLGGVLRRRRLRRGCWPSRALRHAKRRSCVRRSVYGSGRRTCAVVAIGAASDLLLRCTFFCVFRRRLAPAGWLRQLKAWHVATRAR
eukprot:366442-Chlamydomonas_euryale.AAC.18